MWLPAVALHRLGVVEISPSPHHCLRTAHPVRGQLIARHQSQSSPDPAGKDSATSSPVLTEESDFPELQVAAACRRVERRACANEAVPRLQSASSWLVME